MGSELGRELIQDLKSFGIIMLIAIIVTIVVSIVIAIVKAAQKKSQERFAQRQNDLSSVGLHDTRRVITPNDYSERLTMISASKKNLETLYQSYLAGRTDLSKTGKQLFEQFKENYYAQVTDEYVLAEIRPLLSQYEPLFQKVITISEIDEMSGHEFESFAAALLVKLNYINVEVTKASNDQGVDVIAEKDGMRYAIQCKRYASNLGNKPIQEVHTGKYLYHCDVGVVLTNRYFTAGAKQAATMTGTLLWDRDYLIQMLNEVQF